MDGGPDAGRLFIGVDVPIGSLTSLNTVLSVNDAAAALSTFKLDCRLARRSSVDSSFGYKDKFKKSKFTNKCGARWLSSIGW